MRSSGKAVTSANVKIENLDALGRARDRLASLRDGGDKIIARAVSTLKRRLTPWMKRDIAQQYTLPSNKIGSRLRCKGDANSVTLIGLGRNQRLTNFPCRQTRSGVRVEIQKGRPVDISHAFIQAPTGSAAASGPQAFIRNAAMTDLPDDVVDIAVVAKDKHGYPISLLGGPSVAEMMASGDRIDRATDFGRQVFGDEVDRLAEVARGK